MSKVNLYDLSHLYSYLMISHHSPLRNLYIIYSVIYLAVVMVVIVELVIDIMQ